MNAFHSSLSAAARFFVAAAVGVALTAAWVAAETASHQAVDNSASAIAPPNVRYVKLPTIEVIGRRLAKPTAA